MHKDLYKCIVARCGIAPSEFWRMTPSECWLIIDANTPPKTYGNLSEREVNEMLEYRKELEAKGVVLA